MLKEYIKCCTDCYNICQRNPPPKRGGKQPRGKSRTRSKLRSKLRSKSRSKLRSKSRSKSRKSKTH